ncbi:hypothetical protein CRG98_015833 [Punica granatum]|uniref:Uncharacterized protein n=1 Tax=Punica granatum TaxID=22663 RepID=A0A2I0K6M9_PUNGR|nr:hypothetical protein CRG98_015833 [Punica granatum]
MEKVQWLTGRGVSRRRPLVAGVGSGRKSTLQPQGHLVASKSWGEKVEVEGLVVGEEGFNGWSMLKARSIGLKGLSSKWSAVVLPQGRGGEAAEDNLPLRRRRGPLRRYWLRRTRAQATIADKGSMISTSRRHSPRP